MKIQAADIQPGDSIIAYCNNRMQVCKVKSILEKDPWNINLSVSAAGISRTSMSRVVRFRQVALVELHAKGINSCMSEASPGE